MRDRLKGTEWEYATDDVGQLLRFLRARDYDIDKSHSMLIEALEFFKNYQPEKITAEDCGDEIKTGTLSHFRPVQALLLYIYTPIFTQTCYCVQCRQVPCSGQ
jgi:hypothetical protein